MKEYLCIKAVLSSVLDQTWTVKKRLVETDGNIDLYHTMMKPAAADEKEKPDPSTFTVYIYAEPDGHGEARAAGIMRLSLPGMLMSSLNMTTLARNFDKALEAANA